MRAVSERSRSRSPETRAMGMGKRRSVLSGQDVLPVLKRVIEIARRRDLGDRAAATTYYGFMSLPAILLITVGLFASIAGRSTVDQIVERLGRFAPADAVSVVERVLDTAVSQGRPGWLVVAGVVLALWTATGAMTALMKGINAAHACNDNRSFVTKRLVAAAMIVLVALAVALVSSLLLAGPWLSEAIGKAIDRQRLVELAWQVAQWPILFAGLLAIASALLTLGPARRPSRPWAIGAGVVVTGAGWLLVSAALSVYLTRFGSYDRAWGPLAAVIVTLLWLWASAYTLLVGAALEVAVAAMRSAPLVRDQGTQARESASRGRAA